MRIGIDTKGYILFKNKGIGNYSIGLWTALFQNESIDFVLLTWGENSIKEELFSEYKNVEEYKSGVCDFNPDFVRYHIVKFLYDYSINVYYDSSPMNGPKYDRLWFGRTLLVATIHDYTPYILRDSYFEKNIEYYFYLEKMFANIQYDILLTNSENTRNDAIKLLGEDSKYVRNISMDVNYKDFNKNHINMERKTCNLPTSFFLSAVWAGINKNISRLLEAYGMAFCKDVNIPDLVFTGGGFKKIESELNSIISKYGIGDKIHFLGVVSDADLEYIYCKSEWLIFPSLYEGFGMSVVESWRHHVPVITSNNSSLFEIAHEAAILVDPFDIHSICEGLLMASHMNENEREQYIKKGIERANEFSWEKTARSFLNIIQEMYGTCKFSIEKYIEKQARISRGISLKSKYLVKNQYIKEVLSILNKESQIVIFGVGANGRRLLDILKPELPNKIVAFCDNYCEDITYDGLPIMSAKECVIAFPEAYYLISPIWGHDDIIRQLYGYGVDHSKISVFDLEKI